MLFWCLKQVKYFILDFSINGSFFSGRQNCYLYYNLLFFTWDARVGDAAKNQTVYQRYQYDEGEVTATGLEPRTT